MRHDLGRRRAIGILAVSTLDLLAPAAAQAGGSATTWRGTILGAPAQLQVHHGDPAVAGRLVRQLVAEARRLERIFSLYRPDSALVELNRRGVLDAPPAELVRLVELSRHYHEMTGGRFDPTVQPLWCCLTRHFATTGAEPPPAALDEAVRQVGLEQVEVSRDRIAFARHGMAMTLNGIAQGYITDVIVDRLRAAGIGHSLVDMGEARLLDDRPDGAPWQIRLAGTDEVIPVVDRAVATSGGHGFCFDQPGRFNHLLDPATGRSPDPSRTVSVIAATATEADALSTACCLMDTAAVRLLLASTGGAQALVHRVGNPADSRPFRPQFPSQGSP